MKTALLAATAVLAALPLSTRVLAQSASPPPAAVTEAREKVRAACAEDIQKFCANVERARGAMRTCMTANEGQLSPTCKAARAERAAARAKDKS